MGAGRPVTYAGRLKNVAMDEVLRGLGSQREETERRECATEINRDGACGGKRSDTAEHLHARIVRNWVDRRRGAVIGDPLHGSGSRKLRVADQVRGRNHLLANVV